MKQQDIREMFERFMVLADAYERSQCCATLAAWIDEHGRLATPREQDIWATVVRR